METTLITITLLLIGAFNLIMLGALIFVLNYFIKFGKDSSIKITANTNSAPSLAPQYSKEDEEKMQRQKREYEDQLTAINEMLNYNADIAYGIKPKDRY